MGPVGGTGRWDRYTYQVNIKILYVFELILYQSNFILGAFWSKRHAQGPPKRVGGPLMLSLVHVLPWFAAIEHTACFFGIFGIFLGVVAHGACWWDR